MNKTGAKQAGSTQFRAIYATNGISQPPDLTDILRGSYLAGRAISRIIAVRPFDRRLTIVQHAVREVKEFLGRNAKFFHGFEAFCESHPVQHHQRRPAGAGRRADGGRFNTPRPSKPYAWRACRSRRTHRPNAPAQRGCTGRTPPPPPSSSARTPARRTTWSWRSRPGSPSSP